MQVNYGTHSALTVTADTALLDIVPFAFLHHFFSTQSFKFPLSPCPLGCGMPQKRNSGPFHYLKYLHTLSCFGCTSSFLDNFLHMYMHTHTHKYFTSPVRMSNRHLNFIMPNSEHFNLQIPKQVFLTISSHNC